VVGVQVPLPSILRLAQFLQHHVRRWRFDVRKPALLHHVGLPPTLSAAPLVSLEAKHPKTLVVFIVAAFNRRAAAVVVGSLDSTHMRWAS
jgi:hypothetical protein